MLKGCGLVVNANRNVEMFVSGGEQDDDREYVVKKTCEALEVHSAWAHQLEKTLSITCEGAWLVCSVEEIGSAFHAQLLHRRGRCVLGAGGCGRNMVEGGCEQCATLV